MTELTAGELSDPRTLAALLRPTTPDGVLSIYVNADSGSDPGLRGTAIDIRNRLSELEGNIAAEGPPERVRALSDGLRRLGPDVERITSPHERGRGRILFGPLGDGSITRIACQMPVANRVVLDATAFVHPLLELLDEGRPAGVSYSRPRTWRGCSVAAGRVARARADRARGRRSAARAAWTGRIKPTLADLHAQTRAARRTRERAHAALPRARRRHRRRGRQRAWLATHGGQRRRTSRPNRWRRRSRAGCRAA